MNQLQMQIGEMQQKNVEPSSSPVWNFPWTRFQERQRRPAALLATFLHVTVPSLILTNWSVRSCHNFQ
jgi:hypothetical protein